MRVEFGNPSPHHAPTGTKEALPGPAVTYLQIPDSYTVTDGADANDLAKQLALGGVTNLPGHEALLSVIHQGGMWAAHGDAIPSWVWSDNPEFARQLSDWFGCPIGRPDDIEASHYTHAGPPGVGIE